jgi:hypothetical protein
MKLSAILLSVMFALIGVGLLIALILVPNRVWHWCLIYSVSTLLIWYANEIARKRVPYSGSEMVIGFLLPALPSVGFVTVMLIGLIYFAG